VPDRDRIVADQDLLHEQPRDPLTVLDIQRFRRCPYTNEKRRERLSETQMCSANRDLIDNRLQL
jgi:hypothetical protein